MLFFLIIIGSSSSGSSGNNEAIYLKDILRQKNEQIKINIRNNETQDLNTNVFKNPSERTFKTHPF